jgi:hypothetical protein
LPVQFETIPCPACDSPDFLPKFTVRDRFDIVAGQTYTIVRCVSCGLLFLNPRPTEDTIGMFYESSAYDPFSADEDHVSLTTRTEKQIQCSQIQKIPELKAI